MEMYSNAFKAENLIWMFPASTDKISLCLLRLSVNQLTDCSIEVLAEELIKHKVVKILG